MKKCIAIIFLFLLISSNCYAATPEDGSTASPLASYVFSDAMAAIHPEYYAGDCTLVGYGSGTLTITLQRQNSYDKSWVTYDNETGSKSFSNTMLCNYSQDRTLTAAGKYRCKTYVVATRGNYTDTKTVHSPVLTIY